MFPKIKDWQAFVKRVSLICSLILTSIHNKDSDVHLISVDEKTSIQALERVEGKAPDSKGAHRRKEFEYTRHGTTCLMAAVDVGDGQIVHQRLNPTRTEEDFLIFIKQIVAKLPAQDKVVILADQLNIHQSESLAIWIAELVSYKGDLGKKGSRGILKSQATRRAFLESADHRVRFVFTPKHCSWLNPIENWFAKLQRHVLTNGNFSTVEDLVDKIERYITYHNKYLVKPLNWEFKGFIKAEKLECINVQEFRS